MLPISAALPNFVMVQVFSRYGVSSWYRSFHDTRFRHGTGLFTIRGFVMIQLLLRYGVLHNISLFMLPVFSWHRFMQRSGFLLWYSSYYYTEFCHGPGLNTGLFMLRGFVMIRGFVVTICKSAVFLPALFLSDTPVKGSFSAVLPQLLPKAR